MKILVIGGRGTIGKAIVQRFKKDNEIIVVGRTANFFGALIGNLFFN